MGYGSKLTTELMTWHKCPFLSAKSNNKLVIRGHLLLPDNTYSEQERSVGGQPGILAAVGSSSFVDGFTPHPELACPSRGPVAGWDDARGLRRERFPCTCAQAVACTGAASRPPAVISRPHHVGTVEFSVLHPGLGAPFLALGSTFSFLPHFQEVQFIPFSYPRASLPEEKRSRRLLCELNLSIERFSPKSLL